MSRICNRCYSKRLEQTPYYVFTRKTLPNLPNMKIFGYECYVYQQDKKRLDSRCNKGIFVGYDKYSPAHNVYYPETGKVLKHRLVKFIPKRLWRYTTEDSQPGSGTA